MYGKLCYQLSQHSFSFEPDGPKGQIFRNLLLAKCKDEFENRSKATADYDRKDCLSEDEEKQRMVDKRKMLGNIRFIGELARLDMVHESIVHRCIKTLLEKKKNEKNSEMCEDLECLCSIMKVMGGKLDTNKARVLMNQYFDRMTSLCENHDLPVRIRFMLQDTIAFRKNGWLVDRKPHSSTPRTLREVRDEAKKEGLVLQYESPATPPRRQRINPADSDDLFADKTSMMGTGPGSINDDNPAMSTNSHYGRINKPNYYKNNYQGNYNTAQNNFSPGYMVKQQKTYYEDVDNEPGHQPPYNHENKSRDLAPRFQRKGRHPGDDGVQGTPIGPFMQPVVSLSSNNEVSLRPSHTFKPPTLNPRPPVEPVDFSKPAIVIRGTPRKAGKKAVIPVMAEAEFLDIVAAVINDSNNGRKMCDVVTAIKDSKIPTKYHARLLTLYVRGVLNDTCSDSFSVACQVICELVKQKVVTAATFKEASKSLMDDFSNLENKVTNIKSFFSQLFAYATSAEIITLNFVASLFQGDFRYPMFLVYLGHLTKVIDNDSQVIEMVNSAQFNLMTVLPENERTKERLSEILCERNLSFLQPLLELEVSMYKAITSEGKNTSQTLFKWIKANVEPGLLGDERFITITVTNCFQYCYDEDLAAEAKKLVNLRSLFLKLVNNKHQLQLAVLYAVQTFCFQLHFPKDLLLRLYNLLYDNDIIDEVVFVRWKEDINDKHPGKGKALFQVNQWIRWLETADPESSEDEP